MRVAVVTGDDMKASALSRSLLAGLCMLTGACAAGPTLRSGVNVPTGSVGDFIVPVQSYEDRRFASVIRQKYDFSCGSAALATLLRYHYAVEQDEEASFRGMWTAGDRAQIRKVGFSLLDMKRHLATLGFRADGFKVSLDDVAKAGVPGIALLNIKGYKHFVVVKGVSATEVLVGDPALGLKTMPAKEFKASWNGIYFALNSGLELGRRNFNSALVWSRFSRAPTGAGFANPLSQQALMLTSPFYGDF